MTWLLKLVIPSTSDEWTMWDEWTSMYGYESNISKIIEIHEEFFKASDAVTDLTFPVNAVDGVR